MVKYGFKYTINVDSNDGEGFTKEQIEKFRDENSDIGACDALLLHSIIREENGFNLMQFTYDSNKFGGITQLDIFKIWTIMSGNMSDSSELNEWQRNICKEAFEKVRKIILKK